MANEIDAPVVDPDKLWSATFGSEGLQFGWWQSCEYIGDAAWDRKGIARITYLSPSDDEWVTGDVGPNDLLRAYQWLMDNPRYHCGERACMDIEDFDACEGDIMLQVALMGEDIYS